MIYICLLYYKKADLLHQIVDFEANNVVLKKDLYEWDSYRQ
jgi:hypothetical protein